MNGTFERCGPRAAQTTMPAMVRTRRKGDPLRVCCALIITPQPRRPSSLKSHRPSPRARCPTS